jgi:hypothetical protein
MKVRAVRDESGRVGDPHLAAVLAEGASRAADRGEAAAAAA